MSEIGRELKAHELKEQTVVIIFPPNNNLAMTMWVDKLDLDAKIVMFYAAELNWTALNFIGDDGYVYDDRKNKVEIHEWHDPKAN